MLQIAFVDDDAQILDDLRNFLPWHDYGIEVAGTFQLPTALLEFMESHPLNIIVADIQMPVLSGLDFARRVKERDPAVKIMILSQHHDFFYAKTAIDIGVESYLTKPVDSEEFIKVINQFIAALQKKDRQLSYLSKLQSKALLSESMIQEKFFHWLVSPQSSYFSEKELRIKARQLQIEDESTGYWIAVAGIVFSSGQQASLFRDVVYNESIKQRLLELFPTRQQQPRLFTDAGGNICMIFRYNSGENSLQDDVELVARQILYVLRDELKIDAFIGCSRPGGGLISLSRCYYEAIYVLKHNIFSKSNHQVKYGDLSAPDGYKALNQQKLRHDMFQHLRSNNKSALLRLLSQIKDTLEQEPAPFYYVKLVYVDLIIIGWTYLREINARPSEFFNDKIDPTAIIDSLRDLSEYHDWISRYYDWIFKEIGGSGTSQHQKIVQRVLQLIEEHVGDPSLSVKFLAGELYINKDYLGLVFKKQIGTTMVKYITNYRVNYACSLMREGWSNVSAVAETCGFSDPLYFSKCFRKVTGVTPTEYIRQCDEKSETC